MSDILSEKEGEDKESRMTDTDEKESRFWIVKYLLKGLVAFVVVYGLLTLVIYVSNKTTPAPKSTSSQDNTSSSDNGDRGCGMNSFMIRDGVCDELTNTAKCLYDGGDCCLDFHKKDTTLCRECTCQLTVDILEMQSLFSATGVKRFQDPDDFPKLILASTHVAEDVGSIEVCSSLCLGEIVAEKPVNGWGYNSGSRICTCAWLKSIDYCSSENKLELLSDASALNNDIHFNDIAFMQTSKILECGCIDIDMRFNVSEDIRAHDVFFSQEDTTAFSAWHCQFKCQESKKCTLFSWQYSMKSEATCILLTKQLSSEEGLHRDQASGWVSGLAYCPEDESTIVDVSKGETTLATTTTTSIPAFYTNTSTYPVVSLNIGSVRFSFKQVLLEAIPAMDPDILEEEQSVIDCAITCVTELSTHCLAFIMDDSSSRCHMFVSQPPPTGFYQVGTASQSDSLEAWISQNATLSSSVQHLLIVHDDGLLKDISFDHDQSPPKTYYPRITGSILPRYGFLDNDKFVFVLTNGSMISVARGASSVEEYYPTNPVPNWPWTDVQDNNDIKGDGVQVGDKFWAVGYLCDFNGPQRLDTWIWSITSKSWSEGPELMETMDHCDLSLAKVDHERGLLCHGKLGMGQIEHQFAYIANLTDNTWTTLPPMTDLLGWQGPCTVVIRDGEMVVLMIGTNLDFLGSAPGSICKTYNLSEGTFSGTWEDLSSELKYPNPYTGGRLLSLNGIAYMIGNDPGPRIQYLDWNQGWMDLTNAPSNNANRSVVIIPYRNIN